MTTILFFIFLLVKNFISYRATRLSPRSSVLLSLASSVATLSITHFTLINYAFHQNLSFVKGAIVLPSYGLVYLLSDSLASIILVFILRARHITGSLSILISDILRLFIVYVVFIEIVSLLWSYQFRSKLVNTDYMCFKEQLVRDMAVYYIAHGQFPSTVASFTSWTVNPINNSPLAISHPPLAPSITYVTDGHNNRLVDSASDLIGVASNSDSERYFKLFRRPLEIYCASSNLSPH